MTSSCAKGQVFNYHDISNLQRVCKISAQQREQHARIGQCEHIFRMITYSINVHMIVHPVLVLMSSQTGTDVPPRRVEGSDKPRATIKPHRIIIPTQTRNRPAGLKVRCTVVTIIQPRHTAHCLVKYCYSIVMVSQKNHIIQL